MPFPWPHIAVATVAIRWGQHITVATVARRWIKH